MAKLNVPITVRKAMLHVCALCESKHDIEGERDIDKDELPCGTVTAEVQVGDGQCKDMYATLEQLCGKTLSEYVFRVENS